MPNDATKNCLHNVFPRNPIVKVPWSIAVTWIEHYTVKMLDLNWRRIPY